MSLPTKHSIADNNAVASAATAMSSSTATSTARSHPPMKTKNGLQHHPQPDCNLNPSDDVIFDPKSMALDDDLKADDPTALLNARGVMLLRKLKSAICAIRLKQPDSCDLENLYQVVTDLCLHKMGGNLYQRIENECEAHISAALQSFAASILF